jgi:predicted RNA-binding protein with RPS1 domain/predicted transcriptional regulator
MSSASDKRFFGSLDDSLRDSDVAAVENALEETTWWTVNALRDRDDAALTTLAESCNRLGQRYKSSSDPWRTWCAGQLQMIASISRSALSLQVPRPVMAMLRERKNFLSILQAIGERDVDVSSVAASIGLSVTQALREITVLEELRLVQTDKGSRKRWVRVTPLGHRAMAEVAPLIQEKQPRRVAIGGKPAVDPQVGDVVEGTVARIVPFGIFVDIGGGIVGLVHITEMADYRLHDPSEIVSVGDRVDVKVVKIDGRRFSLSMKAAGSALAHAREVLESEEAPDTQMAQAMGKALYEEA